MTAPEFLEKIKPINKAISLLLPDDDSIHEAVCLMRSVIHDNRDLTNRHMVESVDNLSEVGNGVSDKDISLNSATVIGYALIMIDSMRKEAKQED